MSTTPTREGRGGAGRVPRRLRAGDRPRWRTAGRRDGRAVAGLSMGGWGAVGFAMLRPDLFMAAASLSGAVVTEERAATPAWAGLFTGGVRPAGRPRALSRRLAVRHDRRSRAPRRGRRCSSPAATTTSSTSTRRTLFYLGLQRAGVAAELRITDGGHDWACGRARSSRCCGSWARRLRRERRGRDAEDLGTRQLDQRAEGDVGRGRARPAARADRRRRRRSAASTLPTTGR